MDCVSNDLFVFFIVNNDTSSDMTKKLHDMENLMKKEKEAKENVAAELKELQQKVSSIALQSTLLLHVLLYQSHL